VNKQFSADARQSGPIGPASRASSRDRRVSARQPGSGKAKGPARSYVDPEQSTFRSACVERAKVSAVPRTA
jgi:hypothetical protein